MEIAPKLCDPERTKCCVAKCCVPTVRRNRLLVGQADLSLNKAIISISFKVWMQLMPD